MVRDYSKSKIYKITNDYNDDVYVGSTCNTLKRRFNVHKGDHKKEECQKRPLYKLMKDIGFERFRIQLIIDYPCEDEYMLKQKEGEYIRLIGTLNKNIAGRTKKEYAHEEREKIKKSETKYRNEHKENVKLWKQNYYQKYKENISEKKKLYRQENKEQIAEKKKEYYLKNIDKKKEYDKQRYDNKKQNRDSTYEQNKEKLNARRRELYHLKKIEKIKTDQ